MTHDRRYARTVRPGEAMFWDGRLRCRDAWCQCLGTRERSRCRTTTKVAQVPKRWANTTWAHSSLEAVVVSTTTS